MKCKMKYKVSGLFSSKSIRRIILCPAILFVFSCQKISDPENEFVNLKAFYYDYLSRKAIDLKNKELAHELSLKALENQDSSDLESNLGITYDMVDKKDDAEKSLLSAVEHAKSDVDKFKYLFNLGVLFGAQKKIPEALNYYQKALDINPSSTETKHNIELLIQQQQQDQKKDKDGQGDGEKNPDKDKNDQDKKDQEQKENDKENDKDQKDPKEDKGQDRKSNAKYKPRPFKGDQLTEGDVKKILGELSQQDQKIRSNFNKKEQRKEDKNEKDW